MFVTYFRSKSLFKCKLSFLTPCLSFNVGKECYFSFMNLYKSILKQGHSKKLVFCYGYMLNIMFSEIINPLYI